MTNSDPTQNDIQTCETGLSVNEEYSRPVTTIDPPRTYPKPSNDYSSLNASECVDTAAELLEMAAQKEDGWDEKALKRIRADLATLQGFETTASESTTPNEH